MVVITSRHQLKTHLMPRRTKKLLVFIREYPPSQAESNSGYIGLGTKMTSSDHWVGSQRSVFSISVTFVIHQSFYLVVSIPS